MIKISKLADYGMVLLTIMAKEEQEATFTARDLANDSSLPLPMVSKVLKLLARGELLDSHRGVKGGYSLARHPESINAAEIISVLDGPIALTSCLEKEGSCCGISSVCSVKDYWNLINGRIIDSLSRISLADITSSSTSSSCCLTEKRQGS